MNELIARQRVNRRKHRNISPAQIEPHESAQSADRNVILKRIGAGNYSKKRYVIIGSVVAVVILLFLFSSSVLNHSLRGIGGGLGNLPTDPGLSSLLDSYLSPGNSPDPGAGAIVPSGKLLMSWEPRNYVVQPGDTVSGIAQDFGLSYGTIISFNGITNVYNLQAGAEIQIPPVDGVIHVVRGNDSLSGIAENYGVDLEPILDINNIVSDIIHEGDKIFVPSGEMPDYDLRRAMGNLFIYPLRGVLSSGFAYRTDPFTGVRTMHRGYDIVSKIGSTVVASNAGRVVYTGESALYGRYVLIQHRQGYQTLYAHLNRWNVSQGQWVNQRQKIGEVGNTGRSTGPHLHFSIFLHGDAVDPGRYLLSY